ncbi:VWA domain-containing protein [Adhaeribacter swui]|uniref:VWA domain-containing protein n=1 Tax=Adhaeribacter swui TaxID=2086471 RepID=A0A7G7GC34_9BACT|nr:VWA domain-containing protein [Adhaeribacter swui]QNF34718.1 VWA domain-containing protein [Adhaeribacter swui]
MIKSKKWVCLTNEAHVFDEPAADGFCPLCPPYEGILEERVVFVGEEDKPRLSTDDAYDHPTGSTTAGKPKNPVPEVGLCVILMDASSSMTDQAFAVSPLTRMRLIATSAASGIFDLERMQNNPNAFVAAFKFDDRVDLMFMDTVANLLQRFDKDVKKFANYLYDELYMMQQGTDINRALQQAYIFVDKFMKKQLPDFKVRDYTPMKQIILKSSGDSLSIANVRVLIYTDGMQYDANKNKVLQDNPFKVNPIAGLNHDIVIGAFFGDENDEGCRELQSLLSNCPIHDVPQFFLFNNPAKINILKYLFRMASGASGFCPKCLEKQLYR